MPAELRANPIYRKSAEMAEFFACSAAFTYSEKDMVDLALHAERKVMEVRAEAAETREMERAGAAKVLENVRATAAEREAALLAELERLKNPGC